MSHRWTNESILRFYALSINPVQLVAFRWFFSPSPFFPPRFSFAIRPAATLNNLLLPTRDASNQCCKSLFLAKCERHGQSAIACGVMDHACKSFLASPDYFPSRVHFMTNP